MKRALTLPKNFTLPEHSEINSQPEGLPEVSQHKVFAIKPNKSTEQLASYTSACPENKRKSNFMEMMGYPKSSIKKKKFHLDVQIKTPTIALTDFMGKAKYSFLKKTGFLSIYSEQKKSIETQKMIDDKTVLSMKNIMHTDLIREFSIKNPNSARIINVSCLFKQPKYSKQRKQSKIDEIQEILNKCDDLYTKTHKTLKFPNISEKNSLHDIKKLLR